jgi:hypothetical protein
MISEEAKAALKGRAKWLPKDPPLANNPEGDTSVREMCEDQTEKELNCVWEIYQGLGSYMRKCIENRNAPQIWGYMMKGISQGT